MASLTVEELKRALTDKGIEVPSGRGVKKDDLVKLYEKHLILNESVANSYSSDDESPEILNTVNGDSNWKLIKEAVESLSNDDLFSKMKEMGMSVGPILPNTRKVYENKYIKFLKNPSTTASDDTVVLDTLEISDNEIEIPKPKETLARKPSPQPGPSKKQASREPSVVKEPLPLPRRMTYIEKIPRGSSQRIIEPIDTYESSTLRSRASTSSAQDEYVGTWSPRVGIHSAQKISKIPAEANASIPWKKIAVGALGVAFIALCVFAVTMWSPVDPYKMIEDEAEELTAQQV